MIYALALTSDEGLVKLSNRYVLRLICVNIFYYLLCVNTFLLRQSSFYLHLYTLARKSKQETSEALIYNRVSRVSRTKYPHVTIRILFTNLKLMSL